MKISDYIYNELKGYDGSEFVTYDENGCFDEDKYAILEDLAAKDEYGVPYSELTEEQLEEFELNVLHINSFSKDSMLCQALKEWYGSHEAMMQGIRSAVEIDSSLKSGYYEAPEIYYVTGIGYDTLSSDLLGCNEDGEARRVFIDFCNEPDDVTRLGGYAYMVSKGLEGSINKDKLKPTQEHLKKNENKEESFAERVKCAIKASEVQDKSKDVQVRANHVR